MLGVNLDSCVLKMQFFPKDLDITMSKHCKEVVKCDTREVHKYSYSSQTSVGMRICFPDSRSLALQLCNWKQISNSNRAIKTNHIRIQSHHSQRTDQDDEENTKAPINFDLTEGDGRRNRPIQKIDFNHSTCTWTQWRHLVCTLLCKNEIMIC
eukprot:TRINITY_DN1145_c0_g3_i2.p2 TRINITY_DN1145_c0_g3~~TRINITY_DN1145_c0_g3_i2.p2  ORF type:complete len:153 (-),score=14.98 TRINITY_DN1145_c0_g3_i2:209-667(-)